MRKLCPYALAAGMDNVCPRSGMNALSRVTKSVIILSESPRKEVCDLLCVHRAQSKRDRCRNDRVRPEDEGT